MELIGKLRVRGFRSLQSADLEAFGHMTALVGRNSSGKSNVLRALNLLFNGIPAEGEAISFSRDHFERTPRIKKKKKISVTAEFSLPQKLNFRPGLKHLKDLGTNFEVCRSWELDKRRNPSESFSFPNSNFRFEDEEKAARQFLDLINYRYIPNRTVPAKLLRKEGKALAEAILIRMKGDTHAKEFLHSLSASAGRMLKDAGPVFEDEESLLSSPSVAIAESISEMLTMGGFHALGPHGLEVADEDWGSGHQAFFLYSLLQALDTSYGRFFGWRQATIWGVEEPESALHQDLATRLAGLLRDWAHDPDLKLQVIYSTHSSTFTMAADEGYLIDVDEDSTKARRMNIPDLSSAAHSAGVTAWTHPMLSFPWNPVILVEGHRDATILNHTARLAEMDNMRFVALPKLDDREPGAGANNMINYIRRNSAILRNRPDEAPFLVLFDWDVSNQLLEQARKAYGEDGEKFVDIMDEKLADPNIGSDFRGLERFFPKTIFEEAHETGDLIIGKGKEGELSVSKAELDRAKGVLLNRVTSISSLERLTPLAKLLGQVTRMLRSEPVQRLLFEE